MRKLLPSFFKSARSASALCAACLVAVGWLLYAHRNAPPDGAPNVILIVGDTLRADRLSCYGYFRETSPLLDRFAQGASLYESAISVAPYTLPSHASLFTGMLPVTHLAQTYLGTDGITFRRKTLRHRPLAEKHLTLAEVFRSLHYSTGAFVANASFLHPDFRLDQGFDSYSLIPERGRTMNEKILPWIERRRKTPFFLFVNYMDTHELYNNSRVPGFLEEAADGNPKHIDIPLYNAFMSGQPYPPEWLPQYSDFYDLSIRNLDLAVGEILDKLKALDLYDNTLIVFVSDHGEFFGEHKYLKHWKDVYEKVVHVPLIIKLPGQTEGYRESARISTVRVPGMILDGTGLEALAEFRAQFEPAGGDDLVLVESRYASERDYHSRYWGKAFDRVRFAIYQDDLKYIISSDGQNELYDLRADPGETTNIIHRHPTVAAQLQERLDALVASSPKPPVAAGNLKPTNSGVNMKDLEELGYL